MPSPRPKDRPAGPAVASFVAAAAVALTLFVAPASAIRDEDNQGKWTEPTKNGPDKDVPGFLVNLGPTGARAILKSKSFVVKYIFKGSPAAGRLQLNDEIVGVYGKPFATHTFGGRSVGYEGPIMDLGLAIEKAEGYDGQLQLDVKRQGQTTTVAIPLEKIGTFSKTFPVQCKKSELLKRRACKYLMDHRESWGGMSHSRSTVNLALLTCGIGEYETAAKQMILGWNRPPSVGTWTWNLAYQSITLCEYYLLTGDKSVLPTIREISKLLVHGQYKGKITKWGAGEGADLATVDKHQALYEGGFGHAPWPEVKARGRDQGGYGPMQFTTILAVIAWQMAEKCGVVVEEQEASIQRSHKFIDHGTNRSGYVAYGGEFTMNNGPVDWVRWKNRTSGANPNYAGRVGCAIFAHKMSPEIPESNERAKLSISFLKLGHKSIPNGHACSILGYTWGLLGAAASHDQALIRLMYDYEKARFNMMRCHDGSFVVLPGRDYADYSYYRSSRYHPTGMMALFFGLGNPKLQIQGVQVSIPGVNHKSLRGGYATAYKHLVNKKYGDAAKALTALPEYKPGDTTPTNLTRMLGVVTGKTEQTVALLDNLEKQGHWFELQEKIKFFNPQFAGVPVYDQRTSRWSQWFADKTGRKILDADEQAHRAAFGRAFKTLAVLETPGNEVFGAAVKHIRQRADQGVLEAVQQMTHLHQTGQWQTLSERLKQQKPNLAGHPVFDEKSKAWDAQLKSSEGRALASAHKHRLAGAHGLAARALGPLANGKDPTYASPAKALMADNADAAKQWIQSLRNLDDHGHWHELKNLLTKAKPKLSGLEPFDAAYAAWDAAFKTPFGVKLIQADRHYADGAYGPAAASARDAATAAEGVERKGVAERLLGDIRNQARVTMDTLTELETQGDWYQLKKRWTLSKRKMAGLQAFDEKSKAWDTAFKTKQIKAELKIGLQYHRIAALIQKQPNAVNRRYLDTFVTKYPDSPYTKMAQALRQKLRN